MAETIKFSLNGEDKTIQLTRERSLLWVIRTDFALTASGSVRHNPLIENN